MTRPVSKTRQIIHVDMDAFYASVEQLDNPDLLGKAVIVGGASDQRGVVSAASYEARTFGVHSAMPMSQAMKLCNQAIVLPVRMKRYASLSEQIHAIFQTYTPQIEPISLDEAFLDVTESTTLFGCPSKIGQEIKDRIKSDLGLVGSVGIASNKFLAKLASDLDKPDGFVVIEDRGRQEILDPLPISRIWGIGKVTAKTLRNAGFHTIKQLRQAPMDCLNQILGNQTQQLLNLAHGNDTRPVQSDREAKSISSEHTFARNINDKTVLLSILLNEIEEVSYRLRASHMQAQTVTLKLRYGNFKTITRSKTLDQPTHLTQVLWQAAQQIFRTWYATSPQPLRLLGFGVSGLSDENSGQQTLFSDPEEAKQKRLDQAFDAIRNRYGKGALRHGGQSGKKVGK